LWRKMEVLSELTLLYEVKSYYINVKLLIMYSYRHLTKKRQKDEDLPIRWFRSKKNRRKKLKNVFKTKCVRRWRVT
jgi:hypothetical protein